MAWLAVGSNNQDLCDKLIQNEVLRGADITKAFRLTDRGDFVPQKYRHEAYFDRPFKRDYVHISAPHMYVTVLDALELRGGQAFLNVGSGSGYLSCLAATLLGEGGVSHGIDVNDDVVSHSKECCQRWYANLINNRRAGDYNLPLISPEGVQFVVGNCFDIEVQFAEKHCLYDRIYIGAGCPSNRIEYFYGLLAEDGVLVVPVDDTNELLKIHRIKGNSFTQRCITQVHFAALIEPTETTSRQSILLPKVLWTPSVSRHKQFPANFRSVVRTIVFGRPDLSSTKAISQILPMNIWMEIFTYCTRDWFTPFRSPFDLALEELSVERSLRRAAEEKLRVAESLRLAAERERDLYRLMVARMRSTQRMDARPVPSAVYINDGEDEAMLSDDDEREESEEGEEEDVDEDVDEDDTSDSDEDNAMETASDYSADIANTFLSLVFPEFTDSDQLSQAIEGSA